MFIPKPTLEYNSFQYVNAAMWVLSISIIVSVLVGMLPLQNADNPASQVANSLWFALYRNGWGLAIAWIILACTTGTGGIFKWFLELPVWQPLGRMSLSFYLVHSVYQTVFIGSGKVPLHFNMRSLVKKFSKQLRRIYLTIFFPAPQLRWRLHRIGPSSFDPLFDS